MEHGQDIIYQFDVKKGNLMFSCNFQKKINIFFDIPSIERKSWIMLVVFLIQFFTRNCK